MGFGRASLCGAVAPRPLIVGSVVVSVHSILFGTALGARQRAELSANCAARFGGVRPRPGWMGLAFGLGADYRHHSRILFVENDKDPWHVGTASVPPVTGVGGTVRRHVTVGGAHHQELRFASPLDAPGVIMARRLIEETVREWLRL